MSKVKVLGKNYGIEITKPWSDEMYKHNELVADKMKENISQAMNEAYNSYDEVTLRSIQKLICAYGMAREYDIEEVYTEACNELDMVQNFWLNDVWDDMLKLGVADVEKKFIGYEK